MTNKLTAKFSDGSEWEVSNDHIVANNLSTGEWCCTLKPLTHEPREGWKLVRKNEALDSGLDYIYPSKDEALIELDKWSGLEIIKVREVVE